MTQLESELEMPALVIFETCLPQARISGDMHRRQCQQSVHGRKVWMGFRCHIFLCLQIFQLADQFKLAEY